MGSRDPVERLPLSPPVFQVLLSLSRGPMHGYALLTDIRSRSDATIELGAGTLYAAIKRMTAAGMVEACDPPEGESGGDARRKFYQITEHGRAIAHEESRRVTALARLARSRFGSLAPEGPTGG